MAIDKKTKEDKKKIKSFKQFDPSKYIEVNPVMNEAVKKDVAVIAFGRMNPITIGHEALADVVKNKAKDVGGAPGIYLSHTTDKKKNPLDYNTKLSLAQAAFGKDLVKKSKARSIIDVAKELQTQFKKLIVVAGSDRVKEFDTLLNKYNGKDYTYDSIEVVSAGERDPDAEGVSGMSASKMRSLAADDNFDEFKKGLPKKLQGIKAKEAFDAVRAGLGLSEELDEALSREARRKIGIAMRKNKHKIARARKKSLGKKASKEQLEKRARTQVIKKLKAKFSKGKAPEDISVKEKQTIEKRIKKISNNKINQLVRKTLPDVRTAEKERLHGKIDKQGVNEAFNEYLLEKAKAQDSDVKDMPGSQPKGYYKGLDKDDKEARAKHFAKNAKSDDDDPKSYKPAPGDKDAETKPSKHTKRFKDMFGEASETDCAPKKRYHNLLASNGQVKFDQRFKLYKPKKDEPDNVKEFIKAAKELEESIDLMEGQAEAALKSKAKKSGMPYDILKKVYDRGVAAWRTGHRPGTNPQQWGLARVNSFVTKSKGTWGKADKDLAAKVRKEEYSLDEKAEIFLEKLKASDDTIDWIRDFEDSDAPQFKGKSKEKRRQMAIAAKLAADDEQNESVELVLKEGPRDPAIFKAIFLAGGPGSGKSFIVGKTALTALGFKLINSDDAFENALKKVNLEPTPENIFSPKGQEIRSKAKAVTGKKLELALNGRLGLVIDGTGKDYDKIKKQVDMLRELGYSVKMLFVNTDLETAQSRNLQRTRTLPADTVEKMWNGVQNNIGKFQNLFRNQFIVVDNSVGSDYENITLSVYKKVAAWAKTPPENYKAKKWISDALGKNLEEKANGLKTFAKILSKTTKRKQYDHAVELVKKAYADDKDKRHGLAYYAGKIIRKYNLNIDPAILRDMVVEGGAGDWGTDELTNKYKKDTPNESRSFDATKGNKDNIAIGRKIKDASDADDKARANEKHFITIDGEVQKNARDKPMPYFNKKMADMAAKTLAKKNPKSEIKVVHHKDIND